MIFGLILLAIGAIALLVKLGIIAGSIWGYTWPVVLIIIGLSFILGRFWRRSFWVSRFGPWCCSPGRKNREEDKENRYQ